MRKLSIAVLGFVLLVILGMGGCCADNFVDGVLMALLGCGYPPIVSMILSMCMKKTASQVILTASSLLYAIVLACLVYDAFYVNPVQLSGLVFLMGLFLFPFLLVFWIAVLVVDRWRK